MDGAGDQLALFESSAVHPKGEPERKWDGRSVADTSRSTRSPTPSERQMRGSIRSTRTGRPQAVRGPLRRLREGDLDQGPALQPSLVQGGLEDLVARSAQGRPRSAQVRVADHHSHRLTLPGIGPTGAGRVRGKRNYLPWSDGPARLVEPRALTGQTAGSRNGCAGSSAGIQRRASRPPRCRLPDRQAPASSGLRTRAAEARSTSRAPGARLHKRRRASVRPGVHRLTQEMDSALRARLRRRLAVRRTEISVQPRARRFLPLQVPHQRSSTVVPPQLKGPVVTVSRRVIAQSMCTMALLRKTRRPWAARNGRCDYPDGNGRPARSDTYSTPARFRAGALSRSAATPTLPRGRGGDAGRLSEATGTNRCWPRSWVSRCAMPRSRADFKFLGICSTRAEACRGCRSVGSRDTREARRWRASPLAPDALVACRRRRRGVRGLRPVNQEYVDQKPRSS